MRLNLISKDCAIFFDENAYSINTDKLMGRNSAGASFLSGYFRNGDPKNFWVYARDQQQAENFANLLSRNSTRREAKYISWNNFSELRVPGNLFYPGPDFNKIAWQRRFVGEFAWSICGITHTTSSAGVMDAIGEYYTGPVKSWDALICTSDSVKKNVDFMLENKKKYLMDEMGLRIFTGPKLPVIPLGINSKEFVFSKTDKAKARNVLKIDKNSVVIVYVGRLSFHAKANPLAMYVAIEKAALLNPTKKIKIIECGWFSNDWIKSAFSELANTLLSKVELIHIDGRNQDNVKMVWQAADVFCSFSDNIQETFGISPIEAMASGIPVVVSDWDGYKESIRDEIDGFKISTIMPNGGLGNDLAISHAVGTDNYDNYIGKISAFISIDIDQAANRFDQLIKSKDLRYKLGRNGQKRALEIYDWNQIIPQYENLWFELGEERAKFSTQKKPQLAWPERPDPFYSFGHYSTKKLRMSDKLELCDDTFDKTAKMFKTIKNLKISTFLSSILPSDEEFLKVFNVIGNGSCTAYDVLMHFEEAKRPTIYRSLIWLLKMGLAKLTN